MPDIVENYGWQTAECPNSCRYVAPQVMRILETLGAKRICDIGSGNGALVRMINAAGYYAVGVEYDKQGIEISKRHNPNSNFYNLGVHEDPMQVLEAEGGRFDVVISTEVIEHLFSPHLLPIFAHRLLVDGGYIIISTPYHGYLKNLAISIFNKWDAHQSPLWHGGHIKFWSRKTLTKLLEQNGFKVLRFYGVGRFPLLWKSMILLGEAKKSKTGQP